MLEPMLPVPDTLVDDQGQVRIGVYEGPLRRVHLEEAQVTMLGLPMPRTVKRFRLKRWQHYGLVLPDLFVGLAVVDAGFLRTGWCSVVDRVTGEAFEHRIRSPLLDVRIADALWNDRTHLFAPGYRVEVYNHLDNGEHRLHVKIGAHKSLPSVAANLRCLHDLTSIQPLVVVLPVGENMGMYSHKVALPLEGTITVGDRDVPVDPDEAFAILDIHEAFYPHHTWWRWSTFAGHLADGRPVAMNLTQNVNTQDDRWNENAIWVDGQLHRLGPAEFQFNSRDVLQPWRLASAGGAVDLTFTPQGERREQLDLGVVKSAFHQPYGTFRGLLRVGGEELEISHLFGVCEDHDARW